ncbi:MAG: hypothetical protein D6791_09155 [Chloroflexi bacterium]|nr:MAG: hypothetical protein D6791_09155 [Chloroflexota bacterium]
MMATRLSLLKSLTHSELKEVAQRYGVTLPTGLKKAAAAKHLAEHLPLSDAEVQALVEEYRFSKLVQKIRDAQDYFLTRQVTIDHAGHGLIQARVAGYTVVITHLGDELFSYQCDSRCNDWQYQVKGGRYPFCKHYPAVIAELIFAGHVDPKTDDLNYFTPALVDELMALVEKRRKQEGVSTLRGRDIERTLDQLKADFLAIAQQNAGIARDKYHDVPERQFERMVEECFQLLEFDTIGRRKEQGWDLLALGTLAVPPYIVVVEAKTAQSGVYDYVVRNPDYLIRLKSYAVDMVRERLFGIYRDYVKYFLLVAPGFPEDARKLAPQFRHMTQGIRLSFLPAPVLLHLVVRYRADPVLTHTLLEQLFGSERVISEADVDSLFDEAHYALDQMVTRARKDLRRKMESIADRTADACFIKLDLPSLGMIFRDVMRTFEEELVVIGKTAIGTESVHVKHDYYALWRVVLTGLVEEFADILEEESHQQERQTMLKNDVMRFLELER